MKSLVKKIDNLFCKACFSTLKAQKLNKVFFQNRPLTFINYAQIQTLLCDIFFNKLVYCKLKLYDGKF